MPGRVQVLRIAAEQHEAARVGHQPGVTRHREVRGHLADGATALRLVEEVQQEYVARYGGRDETPLEPAVFDEPHGALFLGYVDGAPVVSGGWQLLVGIVTGVAGALVLLALSLVISMAFACFGTFVALRAGSGEAVQGFFPLFFVLLFLSSAFFPRDLIEQEWFRTIATYNPVSYMVEGIRSLVIAGWDGQALAQAFGIALIATVAFLAMAAALGGASGAVFALVAMAARLGGHGRMRRGAAGRRLWRRWLWRASLAVRCARRSWKRQVGTKRGSRRSNKEVGIKRKNGMRQRRGLGSRHGAEGGTSGSPSVCEGD